MPTTLKKGLPILFDTIYKTLRHQDYKRVCEIAQDYTIYATGHGIETKLKQFNGRETDEAFKQRVKLTQCNTPDIFQSCIKPLYKVGRTPAQIDIKWEGAEAKEIEEKKKKLFDAGKNFWGKKSVSKYITQRQADLDSTDPNSFVVVEFNEVVNPADPETKPKPYPFEVNSAEAINYVYKNNDLQWLISLNAIVIKDNKGKEHPGEKYYMFLDNENIIATQVHRDKGIELENTMEVITSETLDLQLTPLKEYLFRTGEEKQGDKRYFIIVVTEHKIGFVPAKRFGSLLDPITRNRTCVPLIFAAQCYFEKSIKTMSEFDLTNCLHVFPQKIQYSDPCPGEKLDAGWIGCDRGMRPDGKTQCQACGGSGFKEHTSAQDVIRIRMPKELNEIVSLENVLVYKNPPIDLLEFQKKFGFYELRAAAQGAVYNSDVFSKQEISTTATEKRIDLDAVYDTLTPFADTWSELFEHIFKCIAALNNLDEKLVIIHEFPKDFKMRSFSELLEDLQKANTSGAPSHVKRAIVRDIVRKVHADNPFEIKRSETKDKYFPFLGKTEAEINFIIANGKTTKYLETFYAHFDLIFSDIEYEQNAKELDFYQMDEALQRKLIKEKVDAYLAEITKEAEEAQAKAFENATELGDESGDKADAEEK